MNPGSPLTPEADEWPFVITSGPWPERIGRRCRIVTDDMDLGVYPRHGLGAWEEVVLIEDDPLACDMERRWSCCLDAKHLSAPLPLKSQNPESEK